MPTTIVSLGTNQSIDTETPSGSSGGGPGYNVTFVTTPTGIFVGDIGVIGAQPAGGTALPDSVYTFLVTAISGDTITLKYCNDTDSSGVTGDASPFGLYNGSGSSGSGVQAEMVFKRAFSTITLFEAEVSNGSPTIWEDGDSVIGQCHSDSDFVLDPQVTFNDKQSLDSVTLTSYTQNLTGRATIKPTTGSGLDAGIFKMDFENLTISWLDIDLGSLNSTNTNKAIVLAGDNDDNWVENNIIHDAGGNPGSNGHFMIHIVAAGGSGADRGTVYIANNLIYGISNTAHESISAINVGLWQGDVNIYNNTIYDLQNVNTTSSSKVTNGIKYNAHANQVCYIKNNLIGLLYNATGGTTNRAYWNVGSNSAMSSDTYIDHNLSDTTTHADYEAEGSHSLVGQTAGQIDFVGGGKPGYFVLDQLSVCKEAGVQQDTTIGATYLTPYKIDLQGKDREEAGDWSLNGINRDSKWVWWDIGCLQTDNKEENPALLFRMIN